MGVPDKAELKYKSLSNTLKAFFDLARLRREIRAIYEQKLPPAEFAAQMKEWITKNINQNKTTKTEK